MVSALERLQYAAVTNTWPDEGACTLEEALALRKRLRLVGGDRFLDETVNSGIVTAKKLCTAFGVRPPLFLEGGPDEAYYSILNLLVSRELSKRAKLPQYNTIDDAVTLLKKSKNIIVLTGAGVSRIMLWARIYAENISDINKPRDTRFSIERYGLILSATTLGT